VQRPTLMTARTRASRLQGRGTARRVGSRCAGCPRDCARAAGPAWGLPWPWSCTCPWPCQVPGRGSWMLRKRAGEVQAGGWGLPWQVTQPQPHFVTQEGAHHFLTLPAEARLRCPRPSSAVSCPRPLACAPTPRHRPLPPASYCCCRLPALTPHQGSLCLAQRQEPYCGPPWGLCYPPPTFT